MTSKYSRSTCPRAMAPTRSAHRTVNRMPEAAVATLPPPSRAGVLGAWMRKRAGAMLVFALLFLGWEFAVRLFDIKEYLLPPPSRVWTELMKHLDPVSASIWVTTHEIVVGYLLAVVVSIPLALWIAYSRFMEEGVYPVIVFLQIVPKIAIAP